MRGGRARDEKKFLFLRCCCFHIQETNLNGFVKKNNTAISYESSPSAFSLVSNMSSSPFLSHFVPPVPCLSSRIPLMNASRQSSRLSRLVNRLALIYSYRLLRLTTSPSVSFPPLSLPIVSTSRILVIDAIPVASINSNTVNMRNRAG